MLAIETNHPLPNYATGLAAEHRAHANELRQIIAELGLTPGQRVLDMACGDGSYTKLLAERVKSNGAILGIDVSPVMLETARSRLAHCRETRVELIAARVESLPFPAESFDFIWCAKSLVSFAQPEIAISEMVRLLRPQGRLAILENDSLHEVVLPWPADLELAIRQAELDAYRNQARRPDKRYIARRLPDLFANAGLIHTSRKTYAIDRNAPFNDSEKECLIRYIEGLRLKISAYLTPIQRTQLERLISRTSADSLISHQALGITWLEVVCTGQKPS